jgi:hypothetical protein
VSHAETTETHRGTDTPEAVVGTLARTDTGWTAPLLVDLSHPFFFDHPLDHVSGIQIICGVLDMVTKLSGEPLERDDRRLLVDLRFRGICDLTQPTRLDVTTDGDEYGVRVTQNDVVITEGEFRLVDGVRATPTPAGDRGNVVELCAQELVHRHRIENVVVGAPVEDDDGIVAPLVRPSGRHYLGRFGRGRYSARALIEASRQFFTVLLHRAADKPMGVTTFWMWLGADIPCSPTNDTALHLRWQRVAHRGTRIKVGFDLAESDTGTVVGRFDYHAVAVSTAAYQRFRAITHTAGSQRSGR